MSDEPNIRALDPETVDRIAAGEVVERPASAVKELLENSIDADASRITVAVEAGGTDSIRVTDDGVGMTEPEVRRAVQQHTTSKITDIDDLAGGVGTLGFRGEALHAIGAVSRMTITTRPRGGDRGTELTVEGGEVTDVSPAGCPRGTTVEVRALFHNVPARRKYLKQDSTEFAHVNTIVTNYALANPGVAVTLEHDGRETFATTGQGDPRETALSVYGREVATSMTGVEEADLPDEGPLDGIDGLVSHPETTRASRDYLSTFVNGRYVPVGSVREAIVDAYGSQLPPDRYPFAVVFLSVDPGTVDVNVHPRKLDVRFADESGVREQVETAVEAALLREGLLRSTAPRGRSTPEQTEISPEGASGGDDSETTPTGKGATGDDPRARGSGTASTSGRSRGHVGTPSTDRSSGRDPSGSDGGDGEHHPPGATGSSERGTDRHPRSAKRESGRAFDVAGEQETLGEESASVAFDRLPSMRVLGQIHDTYLVAETDDGLVLIDQHAADERINYERLRKQFDGDTTTQALTEPVEVELTAREAAAFDDYEGALARLGFRAERIDDRRIGVTTVPAVVADAADPDLICDVLGDLIAGDPAEDTVEALADDLLSDLACYPSITGNTSLTDGSVLDLLSALEDCENPWACPHGRPVLIEFDSEEIDTRFERDYPGHG